MIFKKLGGTSKYPGITEQHMAIPSPLRIAWTGLQLASMRGKAGPRRSYQHSRQSHLYASNRCPPGIHSILFHPDRNQSQSPTQPVPTERNRLIVTVPASSDTSTARSCLLSAKLITKYLNDRLILPIQSLVAWTFLHCVSCTASYPRLCPTRC